VIEVRDENGDPHQYDPDGSLAEIAAELAASGWSGKLRVLDSHGFTRGWIAVGEYLAGSIPDGRDPVIDWRSA